MYNITKVENISEKTHISYIVIYLEPVVDILLGLEPLKNKLFTLSLIRLR